jgi:hypothetical protein
MAPSKFNMVVLFRIKKNIKTSKKQKSKFALGRNAPQENDIILAPFLKERVPLFCAVCLKIIINKR